MKRRRAAAWGISGFALGAVFVLVMLLLFGPQPQPVQPVSPAGSAAISVTMTDTFLSQEIASSIKQAQLPIALTHVRAHILPKQRVQISADAVGLLGLLPSHLSATGQLYIAQGKLLVHITQANIGGVPLPGEVTSMLQSSINTQLVPEETSMLPTTTPYRVTGISTSSGQLTIRFNPA